MPRRRAPLTRRESGVLRFAAEGYSTRKIAQRLGVGHKTVQSHLRGVVKKMRSNHPTE